MVVDGSYPNDIRVRKEAETLTENGKKVLVVCPKYGSQKRESELQFEAIQRQVRRKGKPYIKSPFKKKV